MRYRYVIFQSLTKEDFAGSFNTNIKLQQEILRTAGIFSSLHSKFSPKYRLQILQNHGNNKCLHWLDILHNGHALRRARSFYDKLIDMAWAWGWAQVWIVYKHCACTLVHSYARTLQNIKWWGWGKMLEHRCGLCTTIAPVRSYAHAHIIPPDTRSEEGATPTHRHYGPAPVLTATPGLAQISGNPAWLTQGTLPPPLPPYLTLSRHLRRSKVQNTARFGGIKTKLQGHSQ